MYSDTPKSIAGTIASFRRLLTVDELAPLLSLSPKTLYKRVEAGTMPAGCCMRIPISPPLIFRTPIKQLKTAAMPCT